jgi:hypothetical protein
MSEEAAVGAWLLRAFPDVDTAALQRAAVAAHRRGVRPLHGVRYAVYTRELPDAAAFLRRAGRTAITVVPAT